MEQAIHKTQGVQPAHTDIIYNPDQSDNKKD